jgi:hypothetical protein
MDTGKSLRKTGISPSVRNPFLVLATLPFRFSQGTMPDHFADLIRIQGDRLFILDKLRRMQAHEYKIQ